MEFNSFWFYSQMRRVESRDWRKFRFIVPRTRAYWNKLSPKAMIEWGDIFNIVKTTALWTNLLAAYEKRNKSEHLWSEQDKELFRADMIQPLKRYIYEFVFHYLQCAHMSDLRLVLLPYWRC